MGCLNVSVFLSDIDIAVIFGKFHIRSAVYLALIWVGVFLPWFSRNNSDTVKAVTLTFCSIHNFSLETLLQIGIPNLPQSLDIGQNVVEGISDFWISVNPLQTKIFVTPELVMILI